MKKRYIVFLIVLLLSGCNGSEHNQSREELLQELKYSNELVEELRRQNESLSQDLEEAKNEIVTATQKLIEYEENNNINSSNTSYTNKEVIAGFNNGFISVATVSESFDVHQKLRIIGYGKIENFDHKIIDLSKNNVPTVSFEISGELYDFKIEKIIWNDDYESYQVEEVLCSFDTIKDSDVIMHSVLAEGWPNELLSWSDKKGKKFYYLIGNTRLGDSWPDILISELSDLEPWWEK